MSIYLFFSGQARSALNFYAEVLGGEVEHVLTYADMPEPPPLPREKHHWLMHGQMTSSYAEIMVSTGTGPRQRSTIWGSRSRSTTRTPEPRITCSCGCRTGAR